MNAGAISRGEYRLADTDWRVVTLDGHVLGDYYHQANANTDARYQARQLGETVAVEHFQHGIWLKRRVVIPR
jgi:hypothetical protein